MSPQSRDIVFIESNDWRSIRQRPQHLAERLSATDRVLYVNPIAYSVLTHLWRSLKRATHRRWSSNLEQVAERLWVFTPRPALPFSRRWRILNRLNHRWLAAQLRPVLRRLNMPAPILWTTFPTGVDSISPLRARRVVFDCVDDYPSFFTGRQHQTLAAAENELLARADLVLTTARPLLDKCRAQNPHVHLVPNGVDSAHFRTAAQQPEPPELHGLPRPRFGYVGIVARWTDVDTLLALARAAPGGSVVVIGPWESARPAAPPPNFHILGARPYQSLPAYLAGFDVALIPFKLGPLTQAVNPVKLFEYAAAGLPVVATRTAELQHYADWCTLADSPQGFVEAALRAAEDRARGDDVERRAIASAAAAQNDWQARIEQIQLLLQQL